MTSPFACRAATLWFLSTVLGGAALGNNNFFLPGDAFFPTVLTAADMTQLAADPQNPPVFEYSSLGGYEGAFCGYAGYARAAIPELDDAFIANLKRAYSRIREYEPRELVEIDRDGVKTLVETNGMRVLFYPHEFEFPRFHIGLQYNEHWVEEVVKFGHTRGSIRLCSLVDDADAVMESWRDATAVGALEASLPDVELLPVPATTEPITIRGRLKAIVVDSRPLTEYFRLDSDQSTSLLIVDSSGIVELSYEEGEWISRTIAPIDTQ